MFVIQPKSFMIPFLHSKYFVVLACHFYYKFNRANYNCNRHSHIFTLTPVEIKVKNMFRDERGVLNSICNNFFFFFVFSASLAIRFSSSHYIYRTITLYFYLQQMLCVISPEETPFLQHTPSLFRCSNNFFWVS